MHIDQNHFRPTAYCLEHRIDRPERAVIRIHEHATDQIHDGNGHVPAARFDGVSPAGGCGSKVGWPQEDIAVDDVFQDLALGPDVIARREDVHASSQQITCTPRIDPDTSGRILAVGHDKIDSLIGSERREPPCNAAATGLAYHISEKRDAHDSALQRAYSLARSSRITVTLICPGYVTSLSILRATSRASMAA